MTFTTCVRVALIIMQNLVYVPLKLGEEKSYTHTHTDTQTDKLYSFIICIDRWYIRLHYTIHSRFAILQEYIH